MNRRDYLDSVRQYQPGYYQRQMQEKQMRYVQDQMKQDIIIKGLKEGIDKIIHTQLKL